MEVLCVCVKHVCLEVLSIPLEGSDFRFYAICPTVSTSIQQSASPQIHDRVFWFDFGAVE